MMNSENYEAPFEVEDIEEYIHIQSAGNWFVAEITHSDVPSLAKQGQSKKEAIDNIQRRYQDYVTTQRKRHEIQRNEYVQYLQTSYSRDA